MSAPRLKMCAILMLVLHPQLGHTHEHPDPDTMQRALQSAQQQIEEATDALNTQRDTIAGLRMPLAAELESLREENRLLREDAARRHAARIQNQAARETLKRSVAQQRDAFDFQFTLLQEYRRAFETRQSLAESQGAQGILTDIDRDLKHPHEPEAFEAAAKTLLNLADSWNTRKLGGTILEGACLASDGTVLNGDFVIFGPAAYFVARSNALAGLVVHQIGSRMPTVWGGLTTPAFHSIPELMKGSLVDIPLDVSAGDALQISVQKKSFKEHVLAGGLVMIPLLVIGTVGALLTLLKWTALSRVKTPDERVLARIAEHIKENRISEAQTHIAALSPPFRAVFSAGVEYRNVPDTQLEEILQERALGVIPFLDRHLGMIAVLGGVAPLLGLLGTVTGMIHTFEMVTIFGTGDAKLLSGGISEALVTTETGLVIAVPLLIVHALLSRRVRTVVAALEQTVVGFMNNMHRQELDQR